MTTLPEFGPGRIRLLWRTGSYDGMAAAIALLDENIPVRIEIFEYGFERLRPEWEQLQTLMDKLLDCDDSENIWDRLERKYNEAMHHTLDRNFHVHELDPVFFEQLIVESRRWCLHSGLSTTYVYGETGKAGQASSVGWGVGRDYLDAHYYQTIDRAERNRKEAACPIIGTVTRTSLFAPTEFRVPIPPDPRSEALKYYQKMWRPGDAVRLEW